MGDGVDLAGPSPAGRRIAHVTDLERAHLRVALELGEVRRVAGDQVVDGEDRVATLEKVGDDPAADEAGRARDQDPHAPDGRPPVPSATARRDSSPSASATSRSTSDDVIGSTESDR